MPDLTVIVVNEKDEPVEYVSVFLGITHKWVNTTHLQETTDSSGEVVFDVPEYSTVDIRVEDELMEEGMAINADDDSITITYSLEDDDEDENENN